MAIYCTTCKYVISIPKIIGILGRDILLILKGKNKTRHWITDCIMYGPNELLAGAAMMAEIPCPVCKKFERWETYVEPTNAEHKEHTN